MSAGVLIVSPMRNEAAHLETVARAVADQITPPARWIVVEDGSDDGTLEMLRRLELEIDFLSVVEAPRLSGLTSAGDRLAAAAEARAFNFGLAQVDPRRYSHIMKLDGDIELPPAYLSELLARFAAEERLGLAGGVLVEPQPDGSMRPIAIPSHHVHGALKCYSRACFEAIGGVQERLGWDTIDGTYARMAGFRTRNFRALVGVHHRPIGSADGTLRGRARHGECAYVAHYGLLWVLLRSMKLARSRPLGLSGAWFLYGYLRSAVRRVERVADPAFRRFARRELRQRMLRGALPRARVG